MPPPLMRIRFELPSWYKNTDYLTMFVGREPFIHYDPSTGLWRQKGVRCTWCGNCCKVGNGKVTAGWALGIKNIDGTDYCAKVEKREDGTFVCLAGSAAPYICCEGPGPVNVPADCDLTYNIVDPVVQTTPRKVVQFDLPDWTLDSQITVFVNMEIALYYYPSTQTWHFKNSRCTKCGNCCRLFAAGDGWPYGVQSLDGKDDMCGALSRQQQGQTVTYLCTLGREMMPFSCYFNPHPFGSMGNATCDLTFTQVDPGVEVI